MLLGYREQGMGLQDGGLLGRKNKEVKMILARASIVLSPSFAPLVAVSVFKLSIIPLSLN